LIDLQNIPVPRWFSGRLAVAGCVVRLAGFLLAVTWAPAAAAQMHEDALRTTTNPVLVEALAEAELRESEIYGWLAPSPEAQLAADTTTIPVGQGAVFVPYISSPEDEPAYAVYQGARRVGSESTGRRTALAPGSYRVEFGSGHSPGVSAPIEIVEGETSVVPVTWGGLRVEVVDARNIPHRAGYELIRVAARDLYGVGYGADTLAGEALQTWIVVPDLYRVVQPGASYRARVNFATVFVPEGGLVRYRLVIDPETGEFEGAGVVTPEETGDATGNERVTPNLVVGADGNLRVEKDMVAVAEGFIDGGFTYQDDPHSFLARMQFEAGLRWNQPEVGDALPLQKSDDRLRIDLLYTYAVTPVFGPYGRAGVEAELFPTTVVTTEDVILTRNRLNGTSELRSVAAGDAFRVADYWGQTLFFEGAGINAWLVRNEIGTLQASTGLGFRQSLHQGLFAEDTDVSTDSALVYDEVDSFYQEGFEGIITGRVRFGDAARLTTNFEIFSDFVDLGNPTIDWESTLSLKLLDKLSLDYTLEVTRRPELLEDTVLLAHELVLRFAWEIL
jgi:hypothetical protein